MKTGRSPLTILAAFVFSILMAPLVEQALAAHGAATKEQTSLGGREKAANASTEQSQKVGGKPASSPGIQRAAKAAQRSTRPKALAELKPNASKRVLQAKVRKKVIPKAAVQPRMDLIHYGVLEDSHRYDPRPHAAPAGVPSPQTPELTHDHFQELDRNQDGMIDPVERAFGRIDMDRDLHTRTLQ
ncbi:MAG TPA: hypothetical protein VJL88_07760 [Nitrospira sp.]|nr:hypothetical protein [Nitrospira sp.]